jgi:hypothetical protein
VNLKKESQFAGEQIDAISAMTMVYGNSEIGDKEKTNPIPERAE